MQLVRSRFMGILILECQVRSRFMGILISEYKVRSICVVLACYSINLSINKIFEMKWKFWN
jgi:hypothetical protein